MEYIHTCGSRSDWDLVIILQTLAAAKPLNTYKSTSKHSCKEFLQTIANYLIQVLMVLWLPRKCVWLERFDPRPSFKLDMGVLTKTLAHSQDRDLRVAEKHLPKGNRQKAKKVLLHCMRYLELGTQIRKNETVADYGRASSHLTVIFSGSQEEGWSKVVTAVKSIIDQLWTRIIT